MTGVTIGGKTAHQRDKIYAILRAEAPRDLSVYEMCKICWNDKDPVINQIKTEPLRRILQELLADSYVGKNSYNLAGAKWPAVRWYSTGKKILIEKSS